jgi:hypothetical protein
MVPDILTSTFGVMLYAGVATGFAMGIEAMDEDASPASRMGTFLLLSILFPLAVTAGLGFKLGRYVSR